MSEKEVTKMTRTKEKPSRVELARKQEQALEAIRDARAALDAERAREALYRTILDARKVPGLSYSAIGEAARLSVQRVAQIVKPGS